MKNQHGTMKTIKTDLELRKTNLEPQKNKPTWNHKKTLKFQPINMKNQPGIIKKNHKNQAVNMKNHKKTTWNHEKP